MGLAAEQEPARAGGAYRWDTAHPRRTALLVGLAIIAVLAVLYLARETTQSDCRSIYDHGGSTPSWAKQGHWFSDYSSCVSWYADQRG